MATNNQSRHMPQSQIPLPVDRPSNEDIALHHAHAHAQAQAHAHYRPASPPPNNVRYFDPGQDNYRHPLIQNTIYERRDSFMDKVYEHKWCIGKATFYALLFYCLTSPSVIEMTSNYVPNFMSRRTAHTIIFWIFYLLLNCRN